MSSNAVLSYKSFTGASFKELLWAAGFIPLSVGLIYNLEALRQAIINWQQNKRIFLLIICLLISCSTLFPWWIIPDSLTLFNIMQFPWRLLSIVTCLIALWLAGTIVQQHYIYYSCIILLTLVFNPLNSDQIMILRDTSFNSELVYKDYSNNNMLKNTKSPFYEPLKQNPFAIQTKYITSTKFNHGFPEYTIEAPQSGVISLPLIYYHSITATVNGKEQKTIYMDDGSIGINLSKGINTVTIGYDSRYQCYGFYLLLLGILLLFSDMILNKLYDKK